MQYRELLLFLVLIFSLKQRAASQANGDIRQLSENVDSTKIVQIYYNGKWMKVKSNFEALEKASTTICRQLGFFNYKQIASISSASSTALLVNCVNDNIKHPKAHILQCNHSVIHNTSDTQYKDLAVECDEDFKEDNGYYSTQIRLVHGEFRSSGYVEIYLYFLGWGPVCNMKAAEANMACRQLGYTNAMFYKDINGYIYNQNYEDKLDHFSCTDTDNTSHACLNKCFDYPKFGTVSSCGDLHTYINCTFQDQDNYVTFGDQKKCNKDGSDFPPIPGPVPDLPTYGPIPVPPPYDPDSNTNSTDYTTIIATVIPAVAIFLVLVVIISLCRSFSQRKSYQSI